MGAGLWPCPTEGRGRERLSYSCPLAVPSQELRPRLCHIKKGPNGYGFNLHSDKSRPGQYIRAVDPDSPAEAAGLRPQDRIVEVGDGAGGARAPRNSGWGSPKLRTALTGLLSVAVPGSCPFGAR